MGAGDKPAILAYGPGAIGIGVLQVQSHVKGSLSQAGYGTAPINAWLICKMYPIPTTRFSHGGYEANSGGGDREGLEGTDGCNGPVHNSRSCVRTGDTKLGA